jgi:tetratricopeptide (TPR) repeat protein
MDVKEQLSLAIKLFQEARYELALNIVKSIHTDELAYAIKSKIIEAAVYARTNKIPEALNLISNIEKQETNPNSELIGLKGVTLRAAGKLQEALIVLQEGAKYFPESKDIAHNLAVTATDLGMFTLGIEQSEIVIKIDPKFIEAYKNLGRIYITIRDAKKGREIFSALEKLVGEDVDVLVGKGACELIEDRPKSAAIEFEKALQINNQIGSAWGNLGLCNKLMGDYQKAKICLEKAIQVDPNQVEHPWNLALVQLALGEFHEGWKNYEVRFDPRRIATDRVIQPKTPVPRLQNSDDIKGKTIVLLQEQGFGDALQFYRYAKELKEEGAKKIIAVVSKELLHVVRTIPWIDEIRYELTTTTELPDYWVYPMSLPHRYQKSNNEVLAPVPYISALKSKVDQWEKILNQALDPAKKRVGILWAGRETHTNDRNRSMQLSLLNELGRLTDSIEFISLQKGKREADILEVDWKIHEFGTQIEDFSDTAGLLANIDLLISVDSAPIHLAGAMGMPVWPLVPFIFDFRWTVGRNDSAWYPSMRLFRQQDESGWKPVVSEVFKELKKFVEQKTPRWNPHIVNIHPNRINSYSAGAPLLLQSGYDFHIEGNLTEAFSQYCEVLRFEEDNIDAIRNIAAIYRAQGNIDKALEIYQYAHSKKFQDSIFYANYSKLLFQLHQYELAIEMASLALGINSAENGVEIVIIDSLMRSGRLESALVKTEEFISNRSSDELLIRKSLINLELGQLELAEKTLIELKQKRGEFLEYCLLMGHLLREQEDLSGSLASYDRAIELQLEYFESYMNRAITKAHNVDYVGAIEDTRKSIALNPNNAEGHFNLSLYLLALGKYEEGWSEYEWRMDSRRTASERVRIPSLSIPMWRGEPLRGKTIVLMPEQGFGDYIQFVRYAKLLKEQGARVIAGAASVVAPFIGTCSWVDETLGDGAVFKADYWIFPMSLPLYLGAQTSFISECVPYLKALDPKVSFWKNWLTKKGMLENKKPLIGLCWEGSKTHKHNHRRSINIQDIMKVMGDHDCNFVGINKSEIALSSYKNDEIELINAGPEISDFSDSAALISQLDLLITVDSAPAHIAGSLDIPCWVLIDSMPDFRWGIGKEKTPWYKSIKIYRKKAQGGWMQLMNEVSADLSNWIKLKKLK